VNAFLWVLQRVSGLILIGLVGVHVGVQYGFLGSPFRRPVLIGIDWVMLALVVYHGVNGLRTIACDYISHPPAQRLVGNVLWIAGLALFAYGSWGLSAMGR
jgi:succinate dehydrogenase hydrophobic anchor subunit